MKTETLRYVSLGTSGLKVSQICMGSWHLPRSKERDQFGALEVDIEALRRVVKTAMDMGLNFIDTANRYHGAMSPVDLIHRGNSEKVLGEVLREYDRESYVISTKVGAEMTAWANGKGLSRKHVFWQNRESLRRLQMDFIDVYLIHTSDPETPNLETLRAMDDLISMGKVHYIGSSNLSPEEIVNFMDLSKENRLNGFITLQEVYNLLESQIELTKMPLARHYGFSIMAYSPLAEGLLSGKYLSGIPEGSRASYSEALRRDITEERLSVIRELADFAKEKGITLPQLAIAWILNKQSSLGVSIVPIIGVSSEDQLRENLQAAEINLTQDDVKAIQAIIAESKAR